MFFNSHTHFLHSDCDEVAIVNCNPDDDMNTLRRQSLTSPQRFLFSVGLHPWDVAADWKEKVAMVKEKILEKDVVAIGECGLDKLRGDFELQKQAFSSQLALARELGMPVVVHCVKAFDEMLALVCDSDRIMLHGFRGKWQQAKQLAAKGIMLSFGSQYNIDALRFVFTANLPFFLETDDRRLSVCQIYEQAAHHLGVDVSHLARLCETHREAFFRRHA